MIASSRELLPPVACLAKYQLWKAYRKESAVRRQRPSMVMFYDACFNAISTVMGVPLPNHSLLFLQMLMRASKALVPPSGDWRTQTIIKGQMASCRAMTCANKVNILDCTFARRFLWQRTVSTVMEQSQ